MPTWIDLTQSYHPSMPGYASEPAKVLARDGWNAQTLHLYSHAGTHMDAPFHFGVSEESIDQIPVHRLSGRTWKVLLPITSPSALLTADAVAAQLPAWQAGDNLLIETGWSHHQDTDWERYRNELPRISEALAHWCVDHQVNILGVEPPSVADVNNLAEVTLIHQILLAGNVIIVEGLCQLDQLPLGPFQLFAFPLKITDGDGAPARVLAQLNEA